MKVNFKVKELGAGNFGVCRLMIDKRDNERVAVKFLSRGSKVDKNVEREIKIHSTLQHPNVVGFKCVFLTPDHLGIVMEYAAGGELFERVKHAGHFTEDEARYFFQQLISGVEYCHTEGVHIVTANFVHWPLCNCEVLLVPGSAALSVQLLDDIHRGEHALAQGVAHRDLKLENTLLDGSPAPLLKIADFGYSKSAVLHTPPKSTVGTPAYIGPEVLLKEQYDGKAADVWSIGVHLYVMLVGAYPFDDQFDPRNVKKTIENILAANWTFPQNLRLSPECQDLVRRILVREPRQRITIPQIKQHPWYLYNLPDELRDNFQGFKFYPLTTQPLEEIAAVVELARTKG